MQVVKATSGDWTVSHPNGLLFKLGALARPQVASFVRNLLKTEVRQPLSPSILPSRWPALVNQSNADLVHFHWLNAEMMSVEDIGNIKKPIVWTLHDMWAFCGAEHYPTDNRWKEGYTAGNRPTHESGFDLNHWVWKRKQKAWQRPIQIVTPSKWLADCVRQSRLMGDWPVVTIPNAINTDLWQPIERGLARELLGLPKDSRIVAFGAMGGGEQYRKGLDLLIMALEQLRGLIPEMELVIFGQHRPQNPPNLGFPIHYTGHLNDDLSLRALYSASEAMVIPSRMDNLPNTGVEAMACGTPIVAFDTCGLPDIVSHQKSGWLAKAFDTEDLARGIQWVLSDKERHSQLCQVSRATAVARYSYPVVAAQYKEIYERVLYH